MNRTRKVLCLSLVLMACLVVFACNDDDETPTAEPTVLAFATPRLPVAIVGTLYDQTISLEGGTAPYTHVIHPDSLPPGITDQGGTGDVGLTGTPTAAGTYGFTVSATDAANKTIVAHFSIQVLTSLNLSGTWDYTVLVLQASGSCQGEAGFSSTEQVTITANNGHVTVAGLLGEPSNQLTGIVEGGNLVRLSGSYSEDLGTTQSAVVLSVYSADEMSGLESWSWIGPGGQGYCSGGRSEITVIRLP
jgi:hypothetical protein